MEPLCYNCFQPHEGEGPCQYCGFDLAENVKKFPTALRAGTVLNDRYVVGRVLGQGGFGITYLAFDTQLNARVAIKEFMPSEIATRIGGTTVSVMSADKAEDFGYGADRFLEEARTLAKFAGNPNIAGVSSYFQENDTSYFVMEYIEGVSFKTYIANHGGTVSVDDALNVMIPVLRALSAVHREGFIHRDVTPDNIYITKDGNVKLLDFGSARYSIGDKSKSLDVILKVGYAPKEQYIRRGRQGPFTDVYSCAACFYAALTGYLPPESLERLDNDTLVPVSQAGIEIPAYLDAAILKGLAVQPEDRFQSAEEFLSAIESQIVVEVPAADTAPVQSTPEQKKRSPLIVGSVAAAAVLALVLGIFLGGGSKSPDSGQGSQNHQSGQTGQTGQGSQSGNGGSYDSGNSPAPGPYEYVEPAMVTIAGEEYPENADLVGLNTAVTEEDVAILRAMPNLRLLEFQYGYDGDLSFVADLTGLTTLYYRPRTPEDLDYIAGLTNLTELHILLSGDGGLVLRDLDFLLNFRQLETLSIGGVTGLESISALADLKSLTDLELTCAPGGAELMELFSVTQLERLYIYPYGYTDDCFFQPEDLSFLSGMTGLKELTLSVSGLKSLSGLENLAALTELDLWVNNAALSDLEPLRGLSSVRTMDLSFSGQKTPLSLSPFRDLTSLRNLKLQGHDKDFTDWAALDHIRNLSTPNRN